MVKKLRSAGANWRLLVHEPGGVSHDVVPKTLGKPANKWGQEHVIAGTEFDELVVGRWAHIEQMDTGSWWMNISGITINLRADRDGRPKAVQVYGPGDYGDAVEGVKYDLTWSHEAEHVGTAHEPHAYLSTACPHEHRDGQPGLHASCRLTCKTCDAPCRCSNHPERDGQNLPLPWVDQAREIALRLLRIVEASGVDLRAADPDLFERLRDERDLFWAHGEVQPAGDWHPPTTTTEENR
jgi:hypothetical protein